MRGAHKAKRRSRLCPCFLAWIVNQASMGVGDTLTNVMQSFQYSTQAIVDKASDTNCDISTFTLE